MTNSTLIGKQGEALFKQVMSANYIVEDVSNCSAYWDKDIDFLLTNLRTGNSYQRKLQRKLSPIIRLHDETA